MSLTDAAIQRIKNMIVSGELQPGDRLPVENELAARLGLSRGSLREAVRALAMLGVLDVRRGDGTYVTSLDPQKLLNIIGFVIDLLHDATLSDLAQVRRLLEPSVAGLVAQRITDDQLRRLDGIVDAMAAAANIEDLVRGDSEFHDAIAEFSGNPVLVSILRGVSAPTFSARVRHGHGADNAVEITVAEHRNILAALRAHDAELAAARMLTHVSVMAQWTRDTLHGMSAADLSHNSAPVGRLGRG